MFFGFFVISASIASLIATTQTIGALAGAPNAMPLQDTATSLAIDLGAAALFAWLFARDRAAQDKQIARIAREEKLGALQLQLSNKRMLRMQQLRSFARPVRRFANYLLGRSFDEPFWHLYFVHIVCFVSVFCGVVCVCVCVVQWLLQCVYWCSILYV